jgi:hypothetical protein
MDVWFVRSNAKPVHNNPSNLRDYVPGESFVKKPRYRTVCLDCGFARIGWPNTGDLRHPGLNRRAPNGCYTFEKLDEDYQKHLRFQGYLTQFASIVTGDLILMPADIQKYDVHIGVVVQRDLTTREIISTQPGQKAYYYVPYGEFYECAHRVDVLWGKDTDDSFGVYHLEGMNWRLAFSPVNEDVKVHAIQIAHKVGLPIAN